MKRMLVPIKIIPSIMGTVNGKHSENINFDCKENERRNNPDFNPTAGRIKVVGRSNNENR